MIQWLRGMCNYIFHCPSSPFCWWSIVCGLFILFLNLLVFIQVYIALFIPQGLNIANFWNGFRFVPGTTWLIQIHSFFQDHYCFVAIVTFLLAPFLHKRRVLFCGHLGKVNPYVFWNYVALVVTYLMFRAQVRWDAGDLQVERFILYGTVATGKEWTEKREVHSTGINKRLRLIQ